MGERSALRARLVEAMARGARTTWSDAEFERLALDVFRHQVAANPVYAAFARARGADPDAVTRWEEIPPVPARAFREFPEGVHAPGPVEAVFRTSGTTASGRRGEHRVRDLALYEASLLATAGAYLRPEWAREGAAEDGGDAPARAPRRISGRLRVLALLPSRDELPDSSLAHMVGTLRRSWDDGGGGFFAGADWSLRLDAWEEALARAADDGVPVLLVGTAFSLAAWLEGRGGRAAHALPAGSRAMETGGYKGRRRAAPKGELYHDLSRATGIPLERIVAEYGMTEMLSQLYDPSLVAAHEGRTPAADPGERLLVGPPWVRTRVLDPVTLAPLPPGTPGLLCHHDLANLDSAAALLTEDEGIQEEDGLRLLGRIRGAEPRGCSLSMEDYLAAAGGGS